MHGCATQPPQPLTAPGAPCRGNGAGKRFGNRRPELSAFYTNNKAGREDTTVLLARGTPQGLIGLISRGHLNSNGEGRFGSRPRVNPIAGTSPTSPPADNYNFCFCFCFEEGGTIET